MSVIQMLVIGGASLLVLIFFYMRGFTKGYNAGIELGRLLEAIDRSKEEPNDQEDYGMYDAPAYRVISDGRDTGSGSEEAAVGQSIYDYDNSGSSAYDDFDNDPDRKRLHEVYRDLRSRHEYRDGD